MYQTHIYYQYHQAQGLFEKSFVKNFKSLMIFLIFEICKIFLALKTLIDFPKKLSLIQLKKNPRLNKRVKSNSNLKCRQKHIPHQCVEPVQSRKH